MPGGLEAVGKPASLNKTFATRDRIVIEQVWSLPTYREAASVAESLGHNGDQRRPVDGVGDGLADEGIIRGGCDS
jgi:hypothetical protein